MLRVLHNLRNLLLLTSSVVLCGLAGVGYAGGPPVSPDRDASLRQAEWRARFDDAVAGIRDRGLTSAQQSLEMQKATFLGSFKEIEAEQVAFVGSLLTAGVKNPTKPDRALIPENLEGLMSNYKQLQKASDWAVKLGGEAKAGFETTPFTPFDLSDQTTRKTEERIKPIKNYDDFTTALSKLDSEFSSTGQDAISAAAKGLGMMKKFPDSSGTGTEETSDSGHGLQTLKSFLSNTLGLTPHPTPDPTIPITVPRSATAATELFASLSEKTSKFIQESVFEVIDNETKKMNDEIKRAEENFKRQMAANEPLPDDTVPPPEEQSMPGGSPGGGGSGGGSGNAGGATIAMPGGLAPFSAPRAQSSDDVAGNLANLSASDSGARSAAPDFTIPSVAHPKFNPTKNFPSTALNNGLGGNNGVTGPVSNFFDSASKAGSALANSGAQNTAAATSPSAPGGSTPGMGGGGGGGNALGGDPFAAVGVNNEGPSFPLNAEKIMSVGQGSESGGGGDGQADGDDAKKDGDGAPSSAPFRGGNLAGQLLPTVTANPDGKTLKGILGYMGFLKRGPCQDGRSAKIGICQAPKRVAVKKQNLDGLQAKNAAIGSPRGIASLPKEKP